MAREVNCRATRHPSQARPARAFLHPHPQSAPNHPAGRKHLVREKHCQHVVFRPNADFFISPSQSSHGHLHAFQSTHQRGVVMPAWQLQPAISAAEKSTIPFWLKPNSGVQQARPPQSAAPMKKPRCVATAGFLFIQSSADLCQRQIRTCDQHKCGFL